MYEAKIKRSYRHYRTVTREQAASAGFDGRPLLHGWDFCMARRVLATYPDIIAVDFCNPLHNTPKTRYENPTGYAVYIKSKYGRKARLFLPGTSGRLQVPIPRKAREVRGSNSAVEIPTESGG